MVGSAARASQGLVLIPTDSADDDQKRRYAEFAAARLPRTAAPIGPRGMLISPDFVGPSDELAERLWAHPGFQRVDEIAVALPFTFTERDYIQIITDLAERLGPALGWSPRTSAAAATT